MTDPESISSGRSLPLWMKLKPDIKFDIDGSTFSPPAHEDQFFYIRYPNAENKADNQSGVKSLTDALKDLNTKTSTISSSEVTTQHDFSKQHTDSCKKFLKSVEKEHEIISGFLIVHSVGLSVKVNKSHKIVIREDTDGDELNIRPPINK